MSTRNPTPESPVVVITGGASGIGRTMADRFLQEGFRVHVGDADPRALEEFRAAHRGASGSLADIANTAQVDALFDEVQGRYGRLDVLVNNAGIAGRASIEATSLETWNKALATNATGVFLGMQAVFPHMKERKRGAIVNIASMSGLVAARYPRVELTPNAGYYAAKAGVVVLTKLGATQFGPHGIRVNAVCPGVIKTDMSADSFADPERLAYFKAVIPFDRFGAVDDVAHAVAFLASDMAGFINGVALPVDGGQTAKS